MSDLGWSVLAGFLLAAIISLAAWRAKALSSWGAAAAAALGTLIFGLGGFGWAIILIGFFVSSSALSRLARRRKAALEEKFSKGSQRDAGQVAANGGIAGVFVLLHVLFPAALWPWAGFAGALAAANADTWATELGVLSRAAPRLITSGRPVERGTSGGITALGVLAAVSGSLIIALLGVLFWQGRTLALSHAPGWLAYTLGSQASTISVKQGLAWLAWITLCGLAGSLFDSLLGATVQAIYICPSCQKETERHPNHTCGTPTILARGWSWMDNDWVNIFCTLAGAVLAFAAAIF
ncbi:MAG TPA: DUF92 domain-containing protein [Anaerolineaceae bacterium]